MLKIHITIILLTFTFSVYANISLNNNLDASESIQKILDTSIEALKKLDKENKRNLKEVETLINEILFPNIDADRGTKYALEQHWYELTNAQKQLAKDYIINSLMDDYAGFLTTYDSFDKLDIKVIPGNTIKANRTIVHLKITANNEEIETPIAFKLIHNEKWQVYDLIISGVSLMKNYKKSFSSIIRRKGIKGLFERINKKNKAN